MTDLRVLSAARAEEASLMGQRQAEAHEALEEALARIGTLQEERSLLQADVTRLRDAMAGMQCTLEERERLWNQQAESARENEKALELLASQQQTELLQVECGAAEKRIGELPSQLEISQEVLSRTEAAVASERVKSIGLEAEVQALQEELHHLQEGLMIKQQDEVKETAPTSDPLPPAQINGLSEDGTLFSVDVSEMGAGVGSVPSLMAIPPKSPSSALLLSGLNDRLELRNQELQSELDAQEALNAVLRRKLQEANSELETLRAVACTASGGDAGIRVAEMAAAGTVVYTSLDQRGNNDCAGSAGVASTPDVDHGGLVDKVSELQKLLASSEGRVRELEAQISSLAPPSPGGQRSVEKQYTLEPGEQAAGVVPQQRNSVVGSVTNALSSADKSVSNMVGGSTDMLLHFDEAEGTTGSSFAAADTIATSVSPPPPGGGDDLLSLDLSGIFLGSTQGPSHLPDSTRGMPPSSGAAVEGALGITTAAGATTSTSREALATLESEVEGSISEAVGEARMLLKELREAEAKAAQLAVMSTGSPSSTSASQLDSILAGFSDVGEIVQKAQVSTRL